MVKKTTLKDVIASVVKELPTLRSGTVLETMLDTGSIDNKEILKNFDKIISMYKNIHSLADIFNVLGGITSEHMISEDYHSFLGLSLVGHDLNNKEETIVYYSDMTDKFRAAGSDIQPNLTKGSLRDYDYMRSGLATIAYIATGDSCFRLDMSRKSFIDNLCCLKASGIDIEFEFDETGMLCSDQYFAVRQLVKNSKKAIRDHHAKAKSSGQKASAKSTIHASFFDYKRSQMFAVRDDAEGISGYRLPLVFGPYSTKTNGGTGLQLVKRIVELGNGWADVVSAEPGKDAYSYNTITDTVKPYYENFKHGTEFRLAFAK